MSVFKRRRGDKDVWQSDFWIKGVRYVRQLPPHIKTKADAVLAEAVIKLEIIERGDATTRSQKMTLKQACAKAYEERFRFNADGEVTKARLGKMMEQIGPDRLVKSITTNDLNDVRHWLRKQELADSTINRYMTSLTTVLNMARDVWEVVDKVPKLKPLDEPEGRIFIFSREDEAKLIHYWRTKVVPPQNAARAVNQDMADRFIVALATGLRLSELTSINYVRHIDLRGEVIRLTPDITKSKKARKVGVKGEALEVLKRRRAKYPTRPFPFSKSTCEAQMRKAKEDLGWTDPDICWHAARHTCATRLLKAGATLKAVQAWLGHADIKTTERYLHFVEGEMEESASKLQAWNERNAVPHLTVLPRAVNE